MSDIWSRVREGKHVLLFGDLPSPGPGLTTVEIECDNPGILGPIDDAHDRINELLGLDEPRWEHAIGNVANISLRRQMLGEVAAHSIEAEFVSACNRLWASTTGKTAIVFRALEGADEATLGALIEILDHPDWLEMPIVLVAKPGPPKHLLARLTETVRTHYGDEAVAGHQPETSGSPKVEAEPVLDVAGLPFEVRTVLRVATVVGATFDVEHVAGVLDWDLDEVYLVLQEAADLGVPLADRGQGTFSMPEALVSAIGASVLPSLASHWHRRLADLLTAGPSPHDMGEVDEAPIDTIALEVPTSSSKPEAAAQGAGEDDSDPRSPNAANTSTYDDMFHAVAQALSRDDDDRDSPLDEVDAPAVTQRPRPEPRVEQRGDSTRAARHLGAAGEREAAVERYLTAIEQLASRGDSRRALMLAREGLDLVEPIRQAPIGALLRARLLNAEGRLRWRGAGLGPEYTLPRALEALEEAQQSLPENAPAADVAAVSSSIAGVCYDLGDVKSLERALTELSRSARVLRASGDAIGAARLLNDQAEVYLRAGDPVRASHLLKSSREVFEALRRDVPDDAVVIEELAETEHLLARLPLHARLRPGREEDAYSLAVGHARAAENAYRKLGFALPLGRVLETLGRVELRRGNLERAAEQLDIAAELQRKTGDFVGLARTAAAMSDVYGAAKRPMDALALLGESITLNTDKGSPSGLAFNRRAVDGLREVVAQLDDDAERTHLIAALESIDERLSRAETLVGRVTVPM